MKGERTSLDEAKFDLTELRELLEQLAWEHGGDLSNAEVRDDEPFMLWQPVFFGGFWRELSSYSHAELAARIPRMVLEKELERWG